MTEGKCTFGTRMAIDIHMLNEIIQREIKNFRNYKHYRPNFGSIPVTGKFYAYHDQLNAESEEQEQKIEDYYQKVGLARAQGPHSKYSEPATENQEYGWKYTPLVPVDRNDRRFYAPQKISVHTKIEVAIRQAQPGKEKQSR